MPAEGFLNGALRAIEIARVAGTRAERARDAAAVEEPLEIRLNGHPFAVIMRTPGADRELAAGLLLSERIIRGGEDLGIIRHCVDPNGDATPNVVNVVLDGDASGRLGARVAARSALSATSACGVCGRTTIEDLTRAVERIRASWQVPPPLIDSLPGALRAAQNAFAETGGLHAAGLFDRDGRLLASAEDIGRHNAVDKVIGAQLLADRLPLDERLLFVSGRAGYEIVQKALVAGIPILASVSAPSSLAIELAREGGMTLLGFVRDGTFNIYTGAERIDVA
jgi:FdhD protein